MSYRKTLGKIRIENKNSQNYMESLYKSVTKKAHSIHDRKPHFIFSAEKPMHPAKHPMTHKDVMDFLDVRGYDVEEMDGKYGEHEKSILVHNPKKHHIKHLKNLAAGLGQDSSIVSDGYNHELHFLNGPSAGKHYKGQGTNFHKLEPQDNYSTLKDGTHFSHNIDFNELHGSRDSMHPERPSQMKKSENFKNKPYLRKSENDHPLSKDNGKVKLIHYSPTEGLKELDSSYQGSRIKDATSKQGTPKHPINFFYLEGEKPESMVTSRAKSKYVTDLGDRKLYDGGIDTDGIGRGVWNSLKEIANKRQTNPGQVNDEEYNENLHNKLKGMGFSGLYNSKSSQNNVVGMFGNVPLDKEYKMHPNDFNKISATDHHANEASKKEAKTFSDENGFHDHKFLHGLTRSIKEDK